MNYSKMTSVLKITGSVAGFVGFFLMVGAVGSSDLAIEMGVYEPWYTHLGTMIFGLVLMGIGAFILSLFEEESEEEFDD